MVRTERHDRRSQGEITDFSAVGLDPARLAYFRRYFDSYFNDEFRRGQGTEDILENLARFGAGGDWIDLGAGPSTLFWTIPLDNIRSISCCDMAPEALKVLNEFVNGDELPQCYRQVLEMYAKPAEHLAEMKRKVSHYYVFDAMEAWPEEFARHRYDLITEFGLFGLAASPERYLDCFEHLRPHLSDNGRIVGADWIRSPAFVRREGHDNTYLSPELVAEGAKRADVRLLHCRRSEIRGDPLYDAVICWAMAVG